MLPSISISTSCLEACPELRLGILSCSIKVEDRSSALDLAIQSGLQVQKEKLGAVAAIQKIPAIQATRAAYKALGKDPSRYRPSAEALLRRTVQGKGLYNVSNAVDALNLITIKTGFSIGGYDLDKIEGEVLLDRAGPDLVYDAIGRGGLNIEGLPVLFDQKGPFGSPTSDSVRTSVNGGTSQFMMVFFDFNGHSQLSDALNRTQMIFESYVYGGEFEILISGK